LQATPRAALGFCSANRAENLCYRFTHGQKLLPQFRKIVGLVFQAVKFKIFPCHVEPIETSSRKAHRGFFRYARSFDFAQDDKVFGCARNENLFGAYLLTDCAYSKTELEPQGGEQIERRT